MSDLKTILIVDDEPRTRLGIKRTLEVWSEGNLKMISVEGGNEALRVLKEEKVNLIITDIRMPEMTGLKFLEYVNQMKHCPVVIILSGYSEFEYAQKAISLNVLHYLLKPIDKKKLIDSVKNALEVEKERERVGMFKKLIDDELMKINNNQQPLNKSIKEALTIVNEHLKEQLNLTDVANHVHLNPSYFSTLFKEQLNLTFSEYITRKRIQRAKQLLITTNLPINEISEEVGYSTAKYFTKIFKESEGVAPGQFRKEHFEYSENN